MVAATNPVNPEKLGAVGKDHVAQCFAAAGAELETLRYKVVKGVTAGVPWIAETAFAWAPGAQGRCMTAGINWSPALKEDANPLRALLGYGQLLADQYCGPGEPILLFMHLITPRVQFLDRGKSTVASETFGAMALQDAVIAVTKAWAKQREAERRDQKRDQRRRDALLRKRRVTVKDAVWQVLPFAYAKASSDGAHPTSPRQIYYAARPRVLALTAKDELDGNYFSYTLLPQFMQENRELTIDWRVHFKPRGNLTEPHTRRLVPLGTAEVIRYRVSWTNGIDPDPIYTLPPWTADTAGPHNRFGAVIVVEKEGIADLLIEDGVGDRFDVAIVGNEGQSVEAELKLADGLDLPVFILHDFDRTGLTIAANLRDGTWRHRYRNSFPVFDVGLRLEQIDGLETEPIDANNLKSVTDNRLRECGAIEAEIGFLRSRRVELNALTTKQLVNIVETALLDRGVEKIIPTEDELANAWRAAKARAEILEAIDRANKDAESWLQVDAPLDLAQRVRALLAQNPSLSWDVVLRRIAIGERLH
jgi:hypothetical protein